MRTQRASRRHAVIVYMVALLLGCCLALLADGEHGASAAQEAVAAAARAELVRANTQFAFDLYRALAADPGNLFFSPYSVSTALAMTFTGARDATEYQMAEALRFTLPQGDLHPTFGALNADLTGRVEGIDGVQLSIANALWGQDGHPFLSEFLDLLETFSGAPMQRTDFAGAPEQARTDINEWVGERTEGLIPDLMAPGSITSETRLVLANAIYFLGTWKLPFDKELTQDAPFHRLDGTEVSVPMMSIEDHFHYTEGKDYQAVELSYTGEQLSMVVLLPAEGTFEAFETALTVERLNRILGQMYSQKLWLAMPRFELTSEFSLADTLAQLGMPDAFTGAADFSGMDGTRDLFIGHVAHKAYVSVNEEGTEAAAATGVSMTLSMPAMMTIDRPFIFLIRDVETGTILFIGRVTDPS